MDRQNQLNFCKVCIHRKDDIQRGIICGITDTYADFEFSCLNYKEDKNLVAKEKEMQSKKTANNSNSNKNRNVLFGILFGIIAIAGIGYLKVSSKNKEKNTPKIEQLPIQKKTKSKLTKRQLIKNQPKAISYLASANRIAIKRKRVNKDTSFMVAKNLQVSVHKRYYMSIVANDSLPILAISRGYCFTQNKVNMDKSKSMREQWLAIRKKFSPDFSYELTKKYTVEDKKVEEMNFIIPGYRNVYGVARLIEIDGKRYFFHFAFKQETPDYNMLRRHLNYYVIIK